MNEFLMFLIDSIKAFFGYGSANISVSDSQVAGFFVGGAIGEALGMPVVGKSEEFLSKDPVTDMLGFSDFKTSAGSSSVCGESQLEFAKYLNDNFDRDFSLDKFCRLCNNWYLIKAKDEDRRLKIILPCAALAGILYASLKKNKKLFLSLIPDILCDEAIAPASVVFYIFKYVSEGKTLVKSCKKARKSTKILLKKIGLQISPSNITLKIQNLITNCVCDTSNYHDGVLKAINHGGNTDLVGNILGNLLGLFYGLENIPYFWRKFLGTQSNMIQLSNIVCQMLCVKHS